MIFEDIKTVDLSLHFLLFLLPKSNRLNDHCPWGRHTEGRKQVFLFLVHGNLRGRYVGKGASQRENSPPGQ